MHRMERTDIDNMRQSPLQTFSHGWGMSLSEEAETSGGIVRHTAVSARPLSA